MTSETPNTKKNLKDFSSCMKNREISWLEFNERVLKESGFKENPPLECLKFISIFCSNLDEFYMIRVGSLTDYMLFAPGYSNEHTDMTVNEELDAVFAKTSELYTLLDRYFTAALDELRSRGVHHQRMQDLSVLEKETMQRYFEEEVMPLLSPQIINNRHPFPHINNKKLHVGVTIEDNGKTLFGLIAVPKTLDRIIPLEGKNRFVLLEDVIFHFSHLVFDPYTVKDRTILAVTRNADINTEEEGAADEDTDYRQFMQNQIGKRQRMAPVRLELQHGAGSELRSFFTKKLNIGKKQVFQTSVPLDLSYCFGLGDTLSEDLRNELTWPPHNPVDTYLSEKKAGLMKYVQKKDIFFSYPFEGISPFIEMVRQAAEDPAVLSIKITLYRLDVQSRLAESLIRAAENGKEVIVLMELRARFDEKNNIDWSKRLDEADCNVIYGLPGYKVHSKICLITRKESGKIQYITQIGTGNYNEKTAKLYTDIAMITSDPEIGNDAAKFFNRLLIGKLGGKYDRLWVAPNHLKNNILDRIDKERRKADSGERGRIIIKCNSLTDKDIIKKLIEASQSGVRIKMIIRGICCLIPGVPGLTENISVISIVGRFLEHSRIYCFGEGDERRIFISSADLMTRNTERRVEIACPIRDQDIKLQISEMLDILMKDNTKAWELFSDGKYILRRPSDTPINSQTIFTELARERAGDADGKERSAGSPTTRLKSASLKK